MKDSGKIYDIPFIHITNHAVDRFRERSKTGIHNLSKFEIVNYLKDRIKKILNKEIESVELIEIVKRSKKYKDERIQRASNNICLLDIETSLLYVINLDDGRLVTIRNDTGNYKKRRNKVIKVCNNNKIWISVSNEEYLKEIYYIMKKGGIYPNLLFIEGNYDNIKKGLYYSFFIKKIEKIFFINNIFDKEIENNINECSEDSFITLHGYKDSSMFLENYNVYCNIPFNDYYDYLKIKNIDNLFKEFTKTKLLHSSIINLKNMNCELSKNKDVSYIDYKIISLYEIDVKNYLIDIWISFLNKIKNKIKAEENNE